MLKLNKKKTLTYSNSCGRVKLGSKLKT